ncbi:MAG: sigma-54-dependent Fis family transcriptional regulator [Thermodesulfobacteriales bacterium]|nr:MAG: sigma-54-dependent Fis family transcriptional regulator [Thermodesulfobacteriales bacterium]
MSSLILIIEDERLLSKQLQKALSQEGYFVITSYGGVEGLQIAKRENPDLVILDLKLPDRDGLQVLKDLSGFERMPPTIMMTAHGSVEVAVSAIRDGAYDFIEKPFPLDKLKVMVRNALRISELNNSLNAVARRAQEKYGVDSIMGKSESIKEIMDLFKKLTETDPKTILIRGESGTGKGLAAKVLHFNGLRKQGPFIELNCAAIPETLLESELFGHEAGAFTDAKKLNKGILEQADGGTVFLDEIGDMSLSLQAKLVKAVEERSFRRVGGNRDITVDICVMAATNHDLKSLVKNGGFREDLYHRLNVINFEMPSLRERKEDIPLITDYFISYFNLDLNKNINIIPSEVRKTFLHYDWPGNVRELRSTIERAVLLSEDGLLNPKYVKIEEGDSLKVQDGDDKMVIDIPHDDASLYKIERKVITKALDLHNWNQTRTAEMLGITREVLRYRMKKWGLLS